MAERQARAVVEVEAEEVEGGAEELDGGGGEELGDALGVQGLGAGGQERRGQVRRQQRRQVERGEDGEAVAQREHRVGCRRQRPRRRVAEEPREVRVFPEAQREVCGRGCGEFCGAVGRACEWGVADGGGGGVDGVGGEVCSRVECEDECERLGEEEGVWSEEEGSEGGNDAGTQGFATRGIFNDSTARGSVNNHGIMSAGAPTDL